MQTHIKKIIILFIGIFLYAPAPRLQADLFKSSLIKTSAPPYLYGPCIEHLDIKNKDIIEFRWKTSYEFYTRGYRFKLYKGFNSREDALLYEDFIQGPAGSFSLSTHVLSENQIFHWDLTQIFTDGTKSSTASCSFELK